MLQLGDDEPLPDRDGVRVRRFALSSRGDLVSGRLLLPTPAAAPFPLVLMQHGRGDSADSPYIDATGGPWAERGCAVAALDLPLHGARADQKLAETLQNGLSPRGPARILIREFLRQTVADLQSGLDVLSELPEIDAGRVAFVGFSLGAIAGASFVARDPRPSAAAFAVAGAGLLPASLDPAAAMAGIAPRPVLLVNAEDDEVIPRPAAEALFAAGQEPKQQRFFPGSHTTLPGVALKTLWGFVRESLGIPL